MMPERRASIVRFLPASLAGLCVLSGCQAALVPTPEPRVNLIVIMADDMGYADLGSYGGTKFRTPNIDRMAAEGARLTDFYVTTPVCTPSRAAMLTGRNPTRIGFADLLWPESTNAIPRDEILLSELLKRNGYVTALFGKWHLGHAFPADLPNARGFDEWYGIPYPNDMDPNHPRSLRMNLKWPPIPVLRNETVASPSLDVDTFTGDLTKRTVAFIRENKDRPFFIFLSHAMPHHRLGASERFKGKSPAGRYGDAIEELDWSTGEVLSALRECGIDERTLVVFTNDNGPYPPPGPDANAQTLETWANLNPDGSHGDNGPLRGGKQHSFEGGVRVPAIFRMPGKIPAGVTVDTPAIISDIFPTFLEYAGVTPPTDRVIDGRNLRPLLEGTGTRSETDFYFGSENLMGIRSGKWKAVVQGPNPRERTSDSPTLLFDLSKDIGETTDLAAAHPEIARELRAKIEAYEREMGWPANRIRSARNPDGSPKG
ncbi:MAG TPA: sulfatase [Opitutaceae bacterium]|nr:sulfatase [Opitutaceae bacterium]